jgi:chitinase
LVSLHSVFEYSCFCWAIILHHPFLNIMKFRCASFLCIQLGLSLLSTVEALDLNTFAGQAEVKVLLENVAGKEATPQAREWLTAANENPPDYTCTATKGCDLGCCGPL